MNEFEVKFRPPKKVRGQRHRRQKAVTGCASTERQEK